MPPTPQSYIERLQRHAADEPQRHACSFLEFAGDKEVATRLTTSELERRVRSVAARLLADARPGDRALLLYPPGIDFVVGFLGALYAGIVAVPAYPPRKNRSIERLRSIAADADPRLVLTIEKLTDDLRESLGEGLAGRVLVATDAVTPADSWKGPIPALDSVAYLQYTSGSTGTPKGVTITHRNLTHNVRELCEGFGLGRGNVMVSWLPMFHDMGLVTGVLEPLYSGYPTVLMAPVSFVQQPLRWLRAITRHGGTAAGSPNFGYDHCVRMIPPEERQGLDLSGWRVAFNGAEPVRAATLERFSAAFKDCGFRPKTFLPCYGLAEAVVFVSGGPSQRPASVLEVDGRALEAGRIEPATAGSESSRSLVGCGKPCLGTRVVVVDPETRALSPSGTIGAIWVHGASVAAGYWQRKAESQETFACRTADGDGPFLDTGDLGFVRDGEVFITGRSKDLIIIRGRNLYPQDIEATVERAVKFVQPNRCAAFSMEMGGQERLALVIEADRALVRTLKDLETTPAASGSEASRLATAEIEKLIGTISAAVTEDHEVPVQAVGFVRPGSFPITSSGKVQRKACRDGLLHDRLEFVYRWGCEDFSTPSTKGPHAMQSNGDESAGRADALIRWFRDYAERRFNSRVMDERRTLAPNVVLDLGNRGLFGLQVGREQGGQGLSHVDMLRVMEQVSAVDATLALSIGVHNGLGVRPLWKFGPRALQAALLPELASGRKLASFALTEPEAGSNPKAIRTTATRDQGGWRIRGEKQWIGLAAWAGVITVYAKAIDANGAHLGMVALSVREDTPGLRQGPEALTMGMRASIQNTVYFDDAWVSDECVIGQIGEGMAVAQDAMMFCRVVLGVMSLGGMKRAAQGMLRYASRRTVGTGLLADNAVTLARLDELTSNITALEELLYHVAGMMDRGGPVPVEAFAACKTSGPEMFFTAADQMMQMFGGRGYIETNLAPQMLRDARGLRIFEGPTETMHMYLGANVLQKPASIEGMIAGEFGGPQIAREFLAAAQAIKEQAGRAGSPFPAGLGSLEWANYRVGELATSALLLAAVEHRAQREPSPQVLRAGQAMRRRFEAQRAEILASLASRSEPIAADDIRAAVERYQQDIGDVEQHLPAEWQEVDGYLKREGGPPADAPREVAQAAPVAPQVAKAPAAPMTPAPSPVAAAAPPPVAPAVPAPKEPQQVKDLRQIIAGMLSQHLREEMGLSVGNIGYHQSFTALGLDSVGAQVLVIELEKRLGRRLASELLYDFETIDSLAEHLESTAS